MSAQGLSAARAEAALLATGEQAVPIRAEETVDSTNLRLKEAARAGEISAPFLLFAGRQTAGRGRLGRSFGSPPDTGLYMSLLCAPEKETDPGKITVLTAVAVCLAIEEQTGLRPRIKWVNDLFVRGKKVCGILAEKIETGIVIGIGINVRTPPGGFPPEAGAAGALDCGADRSALCGCVAGHTLRLLRNPDDPAILTLYRERMPLTGREITFSLNGEPKNARVTGVAEDGGLEVMTDEGPLTLRCGEISLGSQSFAGLE